MTEGVVFNIQRYSIHDGPGIRTTVFLKGCPMRCQWCSNPESQTRDSQLMIRFSKCSGCGKCFEVCPQRAVTVQENNLTGMDWDKCQQCFSCVQACLYEARQIIGKGMTVEEVMKEVSSDAVFYKNSGGGVTISGGEPLQQAEFVIELLKSCKSQGFHTCLETTGLAPAARIQSIIDHADLILYDIKHPDGDKHQTYTGVRNELILENLSLVSRQVETWIRVPLIKDINDSCDVMEQITTLAKDSGIHKISLLPYHEGGLSKAGQIGNHYSIPLAKSPDEKHIAFLSEMISNMGLEVTVGQ